MTTNFEILPVFPSVIAASKIKEDISELWQAAPLLEYHETTSDDSYSVYCSQNMRLLDSYPTVKHIILNQFNEFKNSVLHLEKTDFEFTTSWMTKTMAGGFCQYHSHKNCLYSGVLYHSKTNSLDSGNLLFSDMGIKNDTMLINEPTEWNILNSKRITIEPDANLLVFFPSLLKHRISRYTGTEDRYSLAFNLFPVGILGNGDSSINVRLA